ncbi:phage tail fiber protein [Pseudomonas aeruginosa]|uniref:phage tail fiber domain-containing protein n=1 Tax=Pseudomonas aeruginosa TaxID=287 RepID=UPI0013718574|nr:phage tail fiber protein [Pseudomonas aeruginosa]
MTVSTTDSVIEYEGNGVTTAFPVPFKFPSNGDLVVTKVYNDVSTVLVLGTDYSVVGAGAQAGGAVITSTAPEIGSVINISRELDPVQETDLRNQGRYFAETHENVFDYLTMLIQQGFAGLSRALKRPVGKDYFDAENRRISRVDDPIEDRDAANKIWTQQYVGSVISSGTGPINLASNVTYIAPNGVPRTVQDISSTTDANLGASLVGYKRSLLSSSVTTVKQMLDTMPIRVWEFASAITDKPDPADPSTWDWTPALQTMVDSAQTYISGSGSKRVTCLIGPGTFLIKSVVWKSGVHVYFCGAELKAHPSSVDGLSLIDASATLSDIGFYGPGSINGDKDSFPAEHRQLGINCVAKNVKVRDLLIENIGSNAVYSLGDGVIFRPTIPAGDFQCENCEVSGCTFRNIERQCVTVESGFRIRIFGNWFFDSTYSAVDVENAGYTMGDVDGVLFWDNYVDNCLYGLTAVTYQPVDAQRKIVCGGNIFKNVMDAYQFRGCSNVKVGYGDNAEVTRYGAYLYSDGSTTVDNIEIENFTVSGGQYGIFGQTTAGGAITRVKVTNPKITGSTTSAITFQSTSGLTINGGDILVNVPAGVVITNCANPSVTGLRISGAISITGNALLFNGTTTRPKFGGIDITNFSVGISVNTSSPTTVVSGKGGDNVFNSVATPYSTSVGNYWRGTYHGTFTLAAATQTNVPTVFANAASAVEFMPTNQAAATLSASTKRPWCNPAGVSNNVSILVATTDGTAAAGTETYAYRLTNP